MMEPTKQAQYKQHKYVVLSVLVAAISLLLWSFRYHYDVIQLGNNKLPTRTNRFTGTTEILYRSGWSEVDKEEVPPATRELSGEDLAKITGQAQIDPIGRLEATIYNGTDKSLKKITIAITVTNADGTPALARNYEIMSAYGGTRPLSAADYKTNLGFMLKPGQTFVWMIVAAEGQ